MKILLCCSAGMSSSILVKSMRQAAMKLEVDCAIASVSVTQVPQYISKVDVILVAPQLTYELNRIREKAVPYKVRVFPIGRGDYGQMNGERILLQTLHKIELLNREEVKMDKFSGFVEAKLMPIALKFGSNRVLTIIRNAMTASMALLIIGSIATLLANIPYEPVANFLAPANNFFNTISSCTTGVMGLFISASMGFYASDELGTKPFPTLVTSVSAFLITQYDVENGLNPAGFGSTGLLTAIAVGFTTVYILHLFDKKNIMIKMPEGVPPAVSDAFSSLLPAVVILGLWTFISVVLGFDVNASVQTLMSPLSSFISTPWGYGIYHMLCGFVFFCGINSAVVCNVALPFILANGAANEAAVAAGQAPIFAATYGVDTMIWGGGTGVTIGLVLLMTFVAKSKFFKTLGRMSFGPGIFNINEPVIFGTPICFNPIFFIPFVILPGVLATSTVLLMEAGIVAMPTIGMVPWTLHPILIGFFMTGGAISTTIWAALVVVISVVVYYPFFKMADKQQYEKEINESQDDYDDVLETGGHYEAV